VTAQEDMPGSADRPRFQLVESPADADLRSFAEEVQAGLGADPKTLPYRFLYDEEGSRLFEAICEVPEYYLTRAEREILAQRSDEIAARVAGGASLVELGSGNASKTRLLIEAFLRRSGGLRYVPVDISRSVLEASSHALLDAYPELEVVAVAGEYGAGLRHLRREITGPKLVAWLGSNIGNLGRDEAAGFVRAVRETLAPEDRILVGIDLRKPARVLEPAYDDAQGVTARFSLNLLQRINAELGGKFDPEAFAHRAVYEEEEGRVKIDLVSRKRQKVSIAYLDLEVRFAAGEPIHTESSYKYSPGEIDALAGSCGLRLDARWLDAGRRFSLNLLAPA
jgi:L-histidine N-alpha-methyltransferase